MDFSPCYFLLASSGGATIGPVGDDASVLEVVMKKTFDAVAFMRNRREELSRTYADLTAEQIKERIQQALKNDPFWKRRSAASRRK
jgi:hypothetical protein